jgi:preprotein translocase subunit SecF
VAGVLTVLGYSLNDTIVILDRVRENLRASPGRGLRQVLNASINETLTRTVLTACSTLVAAILLAAFAGPVVRPLGLVMGFGIVVGTLSSIFVASPVLLWLSGRSEALPPPSRLDRPTGFRSAGSRAEQRDGAGR